MAHPELNEETLTLYVLGELDGIDAAAVKEALLANPDARRTVEELQQTIGLLNDAYAAEDAPGLENGQRSAITMTVKHQVARRELKFWGRVVVYGGSLAAVALFTLISIPSLSRAREAARRASPQNTLKQAELIREMARSDESYGNEAIQDIERLQEEATAFSDDTQQELQKLKAEVASTVAHQQRERNSLAEKNTPESVRGLAKPAPAAEPVKQVAARMKSLGYTAEADDIAKDFRSVPTEQWHYAPQPAGEAYDRIQENAFTPVTQQPLSTFSIDVDTASYANVRRFIESGQRPSADAVRIEELINYFDYDYRYETSDENADPFTARVAMADCPWAPGHKLVRVGIAGKTQPVSERKPSNLVFLLDVSGSMNDANKLPLLKQGLQMLVKQLGENDRVSIVVYAGSSGLVLEPTRGDDQHAILDAIDRLAAGGSTNGGAGIELAYRTARQGFIKGGTNRVILATDGDFNVGVTTQNDLVNLIEREAKSGVFLTVLGFGMGNLKDGTMEQLSNKGNGTYAYIDSLKEARKVLVDELQANLVTIAKDVKIQVEFNPAHAESYRLIGYENRALAARDFNDDTKDAGEIGAGHRVTALYEIVPPGGVPQPGVDPLKYQTQPEPAPVDDAHGGELMTLKIRYKQPDGDTSKLLEFPIQDRSRPFAQADDDFRFAASVAAFGMLLRGSEYRGTATMQDVNNWAAGALGEDPHGYRVEFLDLVRKASAMY
ncbi:MAG: DUF3520 domain-containing protein [Candidatus Hydrogenedens sp.]|nr:DUF3520 domain-containing protein [Candidatus Hydrogenedens sp.]